MNRKPDESVERSDPGRGRAAACAVAELEPPDPVESHDATPPGELSDELLVEAAIGGDSGAFDLLAVRHRRTALRTATQIVGPDRAEDVVQDALLLAYRALATIQDKRKFSRWLSTITRFRALRVGRLEGRRRAGTVRLDENDAETVSSIACAPRSDEDGDGLLREALGRIPPSYAEVLRLHFLHELPHLRIAKFLDVPLSTVKWRCFRGKELLRSALTEGCDGMGRLGPECDGCVPEGLTVRCRRPAKSGASNFPSPRRLCLV